MGREVQISDAGWDVLEVVRGDGTIRIMLARLVEKGEFRHLVNDPRHIYRAPVTHQFFGSRRRLRARLESSTRQRRPSGRGKMIAIALLFGLAMLGLTDSVRSTAAVRGSAMDQEHDLITTLRREHEFNDPRWPFVIKTRDLQGEVLIDATFKHRARGKDEYDLVIHAKKAALRIDPGARLLRVNFEDAEIQHYRRDADVVLINDRTLEIPLPPRDVK